MLLCTLFTKHLTLFLFIFFFSPSLHPLSSLSASLLLKDPRLSQSICTWRKLGVSKSRGYVVCEVWRNGGAHLLTGWGTLENSYLIRWSRVQSNLLESPWRGWHLALTQASMGPLRLGQSQKGHTLTTHQILEALLKPLSTCRMIRCDGHYLWIMLWSEREREIFFFFFLFKKQRVFWGWKFT
jgi:hypothetical protein